MLRHGGEPMLNQKIPIALVVSSSTFHYYFEICQPCFCTLKVILRSVCVLPFCPKINLNFLWSEILLQRYVFFAFLAMFWTWTTSNVWKECDTFDNKYELEICKTRIICLSGQCFYLLKLLAVVAFVMTSKDSTFIKVNKGQNIFHLQHQEMLSNTRKWMISSKFIHWNSKSNISGSVSNTTLLGL